MPYVSIVLVDQVIFKVEIMMDFSCRKYIVDPMMFDHIIDRNIIDGLSILENMGTLFCSSNFNMLPKFILH